MRWRKLFSSPTVNQWLMPLLVLIAGTAAGFSAVSGCGHDSRPQVIRLNSHEAKKLLLSRAKPSYPALARINYIRGRVQLLITVNCEGKVQQIHVVRGHPFLAVAALDAIRRWVYHPFETRSGPAGFQTLVDVNFALVGPGLKTTNMPPRPEQFLARAVHPPEVLSSPAPPATNGVLHLRALINTKGRVIDSTPLSGTAAEFNEARKVVTRWKFRPARWGNLSVPWYMELTVPIHGRQASVRGLSASAPQ